ncbi:MAG: response regulator [Rhizobacter sp.]|nr:response regulator [Rhizobacter sp.]
MRDAEGRITHLRGACQDITERKVAETHRETLERQLLQAQKMESIGTLAGGIAHDFNNILGAILGNVALVQDALPADGAAQLALATISGSAQRARSLVQQILAFGRLQATQRLRQPLRPLIYEAAQLLDSTLPANVALETSCPPAEVYAEVDTNQLQQVLINLCTNAWHAMPAGGGRILIGLDVQAPDPLRAGASVSLAHSSYAHLWVKDDGCGIDPGVQARIFEPFFTTKPVGQGTGLGLSAAHGIVVAHGGTIGVESVLAQGSTFHIHLPGCAAPAPGVATKPGASARQSRLDGLRVLCVDDDPMMLTTMQALLEREGCQVDALLDAQQALDRLQREPAAVDLLVTDYNMPSMNGLALVQAAKRVFPDLPVVMASGFLSDQLCEQATQLGVHALVQKERTVEDLVVAVREVIRR